MKEEKNRNIMNKNNYNTKIINDNVIIFEYVKILHEYLSHMVEQKKIKNDTHYLFILTRGYSMLRNILLMMILYTNNIELVSFHLRKSYLYYTEFIGQIGEDSNSYLQLNSKDACLFVYKKTVYDINEEFRKNFQIKESNLFKVELFKKKIMLIDEIEQYLLSKYIDEYQNYKWLNKLRINIVKIMEEICNLTVRDLKNKNKLKKINIFLDIIKLKNPPIEKTVSLIYNFIKKINKNTIDMNKLNNILISKNFNFDLTTPLKIINKLFNK